MAITTAVTNSAKQEFLRGIHSEADVYKIALFGSSATLGASTTEYSKADEITGAGYVAGGKKLAGYSVSIDGGTAILSFETPIWKNATITARGAVIYNSSRENKAVAVFDFGKDVACTSSEFVATMPKSTAESGLIRIA